MKLSFINYKRKYNNLLFILILFLSSVKAQNNRNWQIYNMNNSPLPSNYINTVYIDNVGTIYIGSGVFWTGSKGGLSIFDGKEWNTIGSEVFGKYNNWISSIIKDKSTGYLYLGLLSDGFGNGGGVIRVSQNGWDKVIEGEFDGRRDVKFLFQLQDNKIFVAYKPYSHQVEDFCTGLDQIYDTSIVNITNNIGFQSSTFSSCLQKGDTIFLSSEIQYAGLYPRAGGLAIYQNNKWKIYNRTNSGINTNSVTAMQMDLNGNLWVGTSDGLKKFDGRSWTTFDTLNSSIPIKYISSLAIDEYNNIWFGTYWGNFGLIKFDGKNYIKYTVDNSEIPSNKINYLKIDKDNNLWIATNNGLAVYNERGITSVKSNYHLSEFSLRSNYPNPFNSSTIIYFELPKSEKIELIVYNSIGQIVKTLMSSL